jgi:hypothetical protein
MDIYSNQFYIYAYLRQDYTPYYIGKGKGDRAYNHRNKYDIKPPKDKSRIIIIQNDLTDIQSLILERYYIRWFGRKDNNTGILRNRTDGGEGPSGWIASDDFRMNRRQIMLGNTINTGRKQSDETKQKKSLASAKDYIVISPSGEIIKVNNMKRFCLDNNLTHTNMIKVSKGKRNQHKGWKCYPLDKDNSPIWEI